MRTKETRNLRTAEKVMMEFANCFTISDLKRIEAAVTCASNINNCYIAENIKLNNGGVGCSIELESLNGNFNIAITKAGIRFVIKNASLEGFLSFVHSFRMSRKSAILGRSIFGDAEWNYCYIKAKKIFRK